MFCGDVTGHKRLALWKGGMNHKSHRFKRSVSRDFTVSRSSGLTDRDYYRTLPKEQCPMPEGLASGFTPRPGAAAVGASVPNFSRSLSRSDGDVKIWPNA